MIEDWILQSYGEIFGKGDIERLWKVELALLKRARHYLGGLIARFIEAGYNREEHTKLVGLVRDLWWSRCCAPDGNDDGDALIYQYTSLRTLESMRQNRCLRLTPASYLNDPEEGQVLFNRMIDFAGTGEEMKTLVSRIRKNAVRMVTFIRSFSENEDSLIMWNSSYGRMGEGAAVGIPMKKLSRNAGGDLPAAMRFAAESQEPFGKKPFQKASGEQREEKPADHPKNPQPIELERTGLYKILYVPKNWEDSAEDSANQESIDLIKKIVRCLDKFKKDDLSDKFINLLSDLFAIAAHLVKDSSYSHEREYRLMHIGQIGQDKDYIHLSGEDGIFMETEKFLFKNASGGGEAPAKDDNTREIIYLGPKVEYLKRLKLKHAFEYAELDPEMLRKSAIEYR